MDRHNLRHTGRIVALGALLVLLQACGGGGGGNPGALPMAHADCMDPAPFFESTEVGCRVANTDDECRMARPTMPIRVSSGDDEGSCRMAMSNAECGDTNPTLPVENNGACVAATEVGQCHATLPFFEGGVCVAACNTGRTPIGEGTCTSPNLLRMANMERDFSVHEHNYDVFFDISGDGTSANRGNSSFIGGSSTLRNSVTLGANPREGDGREITADEVQVPASDERFTGLTITHTGSSSGVTWTVANNQRTVAPTIEATATDRRARPVANDGLAWSYPTIAVNAPDLLDDEANNADNVGNNTGESILNFRAAVVEWANTANDDYYMAGGVFGYDENDDTRDGDSEIVGAFADGDITNIASSADAGRTPNPNAGNPLPADGSTATYSGHSFGTYATLPAAEGEGNRGFFAARAELTVEFDDPFPGDAIQHRVSGRIDNFLFSGRGSDVFAKLGFTAATQSLLENALTVTVNLGGTVSATNSFTGTVAPAGQSISRAVLDLPGTENDVTVNLLGHWGGAFFGQGGNVGDVVEPPAFGGTWAASGQTGTPGGASPGGFGIAFIGSFGTRRGIPVPFGTEFMGPEDPNHERYELVATHLPLFADGAATASSLTLGSVAVSNTTDDRVYLTIDSTSGVASAVNIDVSVGTDLASDTATMNTSIDHDTATTNEDRRTGAGLGEDENTTTDPEWAYTTRTFTNGTDNDEVGEFEAHLVDWSSASGNYMSGGVWSRYVSATGATHEVGAFVDGENPTDAGVVTDATGGATYRGHAYGRTSLNNAVSGDTNPGFFAAKVTLNASFDPSLGDPPNGTITGSISNFLFSKDNTFTDGMESELEAAIGGRDRFFVTLLEAGIANAGNRFNAEARSNGIRLPDGEILDPVGRWGGRFYGTPADGEAPPLVGGVFAVADDNTTDTPTAGNVSFSIIGSFGAKVVP